jgi:site-specific recombinase XerD
MQIINKDLRFLTDKLKLSVPLTLETDRDCYATCLFRSGVTIERISEMLGHSIVLVTRHYPGGMNLDETFDTNKNLF